MFYYIINMYEYAAPEFCSDAAKLQYSRRTRQTLWEECTDANPKLSLNDT